MTTTTTNMTTTKREAKKMTLINGLMATINPDRAKGLTESIIAIMFIIGVFLLVLVGKEIPDLISVSVGIIVGFYFGVKGMSNKNAK